jgi:hypothetical protein
MMMMMRIEVMREFIMFIMLGVAVNSSDGGTIMVMTLLVLGCNYSET